MRVPLLGGAYQARSIIADAQRCINLYPEQNPSDSPVPVTHYPTAGLKLLSASPIGFGARCTYRTSQGTLYEVIGDTVYSVSSSFVYTSLGTIGFGNTPVSMADNGQYIMIVDGTVNGYYINMSTDVMGTISDEAFYGADKVDYLDTFFILNRPGTKQYYVSPSNWTPAVPFDPLYIASKTGYPDPISTLIVMHREIWLVGTLTTEVWYNSGAPDFPFQILPGVFIEHGCIAKYSLVKIGLAIFWLSQDERGRAIVLCGANYAADRVSTHAIETEFSSYPTISDAVGFTYQYLGHVFYAITFPSANKTWAFDQTTGAWHQLAYTDANGNLNRSRMNCTAFVYGKNIAADWQNGNLYELDPETYNDNGSPVSRIRSFPQLVDQENNRRQVFNQFIADMDVGQDASATLENPRKVYLRWSDTKGASWGNRVGQSLGAGGQYLTTVSWNRLGLGRNRVYELSWSMDAKTALNGAFVDNKLSRT